MATRHDLQCVAARDALKNVVPAGKAVYIDGDVLQGVGSMPEKRFTMMGLGWALCIAAVIFWSAASLAADPMDPCTITINPVTSSFGSGGGVGFFAVQTSVPNCPWGAVTFQPWITITSGSTGYGDGSVSYEVAAAENFRQGTIGVGGKATHIVNQNGPPIPCSIRQITDTTSGVDYAGFGSVSHDARWIAYTLIPGGTYLEDLVSSELITVGEEGCFTGNPRVNGDGGLVVYESECDPLGHNPDGNREIMLYDRLGGVKVQLTSSSDYGNHGPQITRAGDRVFFSSSNDFTGGNPETRTQLFMVDVASGHISQLTQLQSLGWSCNVSADGHFVVLSSEENLVGLNSDLNEEVYHLEIASGVLRQITQTTAGDNWSPAVSADGTKIAFFTTSPDLGNTTGIPGLMVHDRDTGAFVDMPDPGGGSGASSMDATGTRVAALQGSLITIHDLGTSRSQILATNGLNLGRVQTNPEIVSIRSTADLTGENPDASIEIFVATCPAPLFADGFVFGDLNRWIPVVN